MDSSRVVVEGVKVTFLGSLIRVWRKDRRRVRSALDSPVEVEVEVGGRSIEGNSNKPASKPTELKLVQDQLLLA